MGWFSHDEASDVHEQVNSGKHDGSLTHELVAGAAGFEAFRAYEQHQATNGKPQSYALLKELLVGFAAAEADKLIETKGLDYLDAHKAKKQASEQAVAIYEDKYGSQDY